MGCAAIKSSTTEPVHRAPRNDTKADSAQPTSNGVQKAHSIGPDKSGTMNHAMSLTGDKSSWIVMGKYQMSTSKKDVMGEGTSSICRKGVHLQTGQEVAIKVYKASKEGKKAEEVKMQKFKRQIEVLKKLQEPFQVPADPRLWHPSLASSKPSKLFMQLVDYSQDAQGNPIADPTDGIMYVVTELAQYSLKDYLALRKDQNKPLSKEAVRNISKAIILVLAGLHAKGMVHLDLKPENLMMFDGRLKLIDVDGCVAIGSAVSIQDSSISFSPCYCAPEWANFLIEETESTIMAKADLDVWSVGMTLCELTTLDAVLKPMYANFLRNGHSHREAGFLFMDWLSSVKKAPLPKTVQRFDKDFHAMLVTALLVVHDDPAHKRLSLAECLDHPYFQSDAAEKAAQEGAVSSRENAVIETKEPMVRVKRVRLDDTSSKAPLYKGALWKLNQNGDPKDETHWLKRDMWISPNGSLCYFSIKENKRLVLIDGVKLSGAKITELKDTARQFAFHIFAESADDHEQDINLVFSAETADEHQKWTDMLHSTANMDGIMQTARLGGEMAEEIQRCRLVVKNRRMKVEHDNKDQFEPVFKGKLWKVKADGDRNKEVDWFEREMWISKNGSLVYWSKKEERELVYYTSSDIHTAEFKFLPNTESFRPWTFQVQLAPQGGVEFTPGEFAAETEEMRDEWIAEFKKVHA